MKGVKNMIELKRCPFCGGEIKGGVRLTGYMMMNRQYIKCDACGLKMESSCDIDGLSQTHVKAIAEDLIRRWNTRKPMERIVDRLEKLSDIFNTGKYNDAYCKTIDDDKCEGTNCFACVLNKASEVVKEEGGL